MPAKVTQKSTKRILVTGGAGFIGSHLVRRLVSAGHEVHVLHRPNGDLRRINQLAPMVRLWACDLAHADGVIRALRSIQPDVIYHLAADTSLRNLDPGLASVAKSIDRNVRSSINLFVAAHAHCHQLQHLIRLGGLEEYGRGEVPYVETQREHPVSPYSASQVAVTHYLQMLAPHLSYSAVSVRPALVYGPTQTTEFFIPALIQHCYQGLDFTLFYGGNGRDLLYIDDVVDALEMLQTNSLRTGEVLNIGSGREYIIADVAATIIRLMGSNIRLIEGASALISGVEHLYCSAQKANIQLGWRPRVGLEEGLNRTIKAYCDQQLQ